VNIDAPWMPRMTRQDASPTNARAADLARLQDGVLDVLVIGGGIVGAGVARDAAMRGLLTGLVEQADFASGASSRSSRLIHGGIRYLAQGRVGLVREASREKRVLAHIAPHLAQPLPFLFPTRRGTPWSWWKLSAGVKLYDLLCGLKNFGRSSSLGVAGVLERLPGLSPERLTGAVRYFDALTNDARLVLDTLRSAHRHGAIVANYVQFIDAEQDDGSWRCTLRDVETTHEMTVCVRTVVNATGPWSDRLPLSKTSLRLTKGVHLVVDRQRFDVPEAVVLAEGDRILFAIPWGERVILGTTDTDYAGDLSNPTCDASDEAYVLEVVNATFPSARLTAADVIGSWAGLRPLVADPNGNPSDISRRHEVDMGHPGWWDVTGGKLTTYRLMAEETLDQIVGYLGGRAARCATAQEPLLLGAETTTGSGVAPPAVSQDVVWHACRAEWARHLDDLMLRRTSWRHYHRDHFAIATEVAAWMAAELAWSEAEQSAELSRYRQLTAETSRSAVSGPLIIAHRGASFDAPENTLAAFRLAWDQGADGIEGDFQLTRDGRIVCIHDKDTARVGGVTKVVAETRFGELRELDVGSWKDPRWRGERIPLIEEVLGLVRPGKMIFIELKAGVEIVPPLMAAIDASGLKDEQIVIISFDADAIAECERLRPGVRTQWLTDYKQQDDGAWRPSEETVTAMMLRSGADAFGSKANPQVFDQSFLDRMRNGNHRQFGVWTVDDPAVAQFYIDNGAWSVTTNRPAWLREQLAKRGD
jgi:glycerol-3-phosphate dehydrogenase